MLRAPSSPRAHFYKPLHQIQYASANLALARSPTHTHTHTHTHTSRKQEPALWTPRETLDTMSYWTIHKITTNYQGYTCDVDYWADGEGMEAEGYVTDFAQYRDLVTDELDKKNINFAFIAANGELKNIANTKDMQGAVKNLEHRGILSVQALDKPGKGQGKNKGKDKKNGKGDAWKESEPAKDKKVDRNIKNVYAILDRFVAPAGAAQEEWGVNGLPWKGDAPKAPLGYDYEVQDAVVHLQYLMTRLDYMKLAETSLLTGSYQSNTENAVEAFRKKHKITGDDMTIYDKKTEAKLVEVVKKLRKDGHMYI